MSLKVLNQKGFAAVEGVLIIIILALVGGTGYYVYHSKQKTNNTLSTASQATQSTPPKSSKKPAVKPKQQYFTIKEWGVRAPYGGTDSFTYILDSQLATVLSKQVTAADPSCKTHGAGQIVRLQPNDLAGNVTLGVTVKEDAAKHPGNYAHIGNYYYTFQRDESTCPQAVALQNQANNAVKVIVSKLEAIPN